MAPTWTMATQGVVGTNAILSCADSGTGGTASTWNVPLPTSGPLVWTWSSSATTGDICIRCTLDGDNRWIVQNIAYQSAPFQPLTPQERLRQLLRDRSAPTILTARSRLGPTNDIREKRARETLCRVIGPDKYRRFLRHGFVAARAPSGRVYQMFPGSAFTKVYRDGVLVERLCVVLQGGFPPTDSLIVRFLMVLNQEAEFRRLAVKHQVVVPEMPQAFPDDRALPLVFAEWKKKLAG
jgi:hypothetical protein